MRVAVVSDIHSNLHALEAVLAAIDADAPDELWCLGDLVGYGPRPNECCASIAERADVCLAGNHDLAVRGTIDLDEFGGDAAVAARWTRDGARARGAGVSRPLEPQGAAHGVALYHGSGARPDLGVRALRRGALARRSSSPTSPLVLVGHSHVALRIVESGGRLDGGVAPAGTELELGGDAIAPQSRARSVSRATATRARPISSSTSTQARASFRRVEYDVERTQSEMREAELPEILAARLTLGLLGRRQTRAAREPGRARARAGMRPPGPRRLPGPRAPRRPRCPRGRARAGRPRAPSRSAT